MRWRQALTGFALIGGMQGFAPAIDARSSDIVTDGTPVLRWSASQLIDDICNPKSIASLPFVNTTKRVDIGGVMRTIAEVPFLVDGCPAGVEAQVVRVDLDQAEVVEVIKGGPVGALLGKSTGGLVNIVRHKDTGELAASVAADHDLTVVTSTDEGRTYEVFNVDATRDYFGNNIATQGDWILVGGVEANTFKYRIHRADWSAKLFGEYRVVDDPVYPITDGSVGFPPNRLAANFTLDAAFVVRRTSVGTGDLLYSCSNGDRKVFELNIPKLNGALLGGAALAVGDHFLYGYGRAGTNTVRLVETACDGTYEVLDLGEFDPPAMGETLGIGLSAFGSDSDVAQVVWQDKSVLVDLRAVRDPPFGGFNLEGWSSSGTPLPLPPNKFLTLTGLADVYRKNSPVQLAFTPGSVLVSLLTVIPTDVHKVYVAYYARPADPLGHDYWTSRLEAEGGSLAAIIQAFGTSDEFDRRYGGLGFVDLVTRIYQQTLGRDPDPAGLAWYVGELQAGHRTLQSITLDVLNGATTAPDSTVIANKLNVAEYYTSKVRAGCAYGIEQDGVNAVAGVTASPATVTTAMAAIDSRCGP